MSTRPEAKAYRKKHGIPYDPKKLNVLEDLTTAKLKKLLKEGAKKGGGTVSRKRGGKIMQGYKAGGKV